MQLHNFVMLLSVFSVGYINTVESQSVACPAVRTTSGWLDLFPLPCKKSSECRVMGNQHLCCKGVCTKGVKKSGAQKQRASASTVVAPSSTSTTSTSTTTTTTPAPTTTTTTTPAPTTTTTTTTTTTPAPTTTTTTTTTTTPAPTTTTTTTTTTTPAPTTTTTTTTPSTTSSTTTTTTTPRPTTTTTTTPAPRPFLQLLPIQSTNAAPLKTSKTKKMVCPKPGQVPVLLFPIPCEKNSQCRATGADQVCCENRCVKGVPAPRPKPSPKSHQPLLGVIPRECPSSPLGELLFEVQTCKSDADCWPRICCPDGKRSYCRTARARLDLVPGANQIDRPVRMLEQYLQCTPPPQYDLFPQKCSSSVDCFPNLCCAEGGKKFCRPPQRSLLALLAGVGQG